MKNLEKGWHVYGQGSVAANGKQVVPDPGVAIYEFTGAMIALPSTAPAEGPPPGGWGSGGNGNGNGSGGGGTGGSGAGPDNCNDPNQPDQPPACGGDPVDAFTGLFVHAATDLFVPDTIPLNVTRTYRPRDTVSRSFGIGTSLSYDIYLVGDTLSYSYQDLILPDGGRIHFTRVSAGTGWTDAVYQHTSTPTKYYGATIRYVSPGWILQLKDGTIYRFPDAANASNPRLGAVSSISDRYGNTLTMTRGANANLTRVTSPNGRTLDFLYDSSNRVIQATDNIGRTATYQYDSTGRLIKAIDPASQYEAYTYDSSHRMLTVQDKRGNLKVTNIYDANGRVSQQTYADGSTNLFAYTLDGNNNVTQTDITDGRGYVKRMEFSGSGYMTRITTALGQPEQQVTTFERGPATNLLLSITDALGRKTAYTYDANGNSLTTTRLAGTAQAVTVSRTYEPNFNRLATVTDALSHTTTYTYDTLGNLTAVTDPLGNQTSLAYNAAGQPLTVTDALNHTVSLGYDGGDLASVTDPLGNMSRYFTDSGGRVMGVTDPLGNLTRYGYDARNRMTSVTDAQGGVTAFAYDANSNLTSHTDAKGGVTTYGYDTLNRLLTRTDPLLNAEAYAYDASGNLTRFTDRKGQVTGYSYDALNRRSSAGFGATPSQPTVYTSTIGYTYDAGNRLTQVVDSAAGTITRSYDGFNRLTNESTPQGGVAYAYDTASRRSSMTVAGQAAVSYTYDNGDRLTGVTKGSASIGFSYDNANRRSTLTLANGIVVTYSYDNADRLTGISYAQGSTTLGDLSYGYDANGRRTSMGGSLARADLPAALASASYNAANQLTQWGTTSFSYDANGNLTSDGGKNYTWNARNLLATLGGGASASFQYDGFGRRSSKTVGGTTTGFLYDGINAVQELAGTTPSATLLTGLGIDETFRRSDASGDLHFLADGLGSTIALADSSGAVQTRYSYEPYGNTTVSGANASNSTQYTGRENDGTGLYYYRARYYDPGTSRFVSEDPIGLAGGTNFYIHVGGNPISYRDPLGLWRFPDYVGISIPILGPVGVSITIDRAGNVYAGVGVGAGLRGGVGGGVGWTGDRCTPTSDQLKDWLSGWGANAGLGIGDTWSDPMGPGNEQPNRLGFNLQTPGVSAGYNWHLGNLGNLFK